MVKGIGSKAGEAMVLGTGEGILRWGARCWFLVKGLVRLRK